MAGGYGVMEVRFPHLGHRGIGDADLLCPGSADDLQDARSILRAYADSLALPAYFREFEEELASLPGEYSPPSGQLLLAWSDGTVVGCCGLRPLDGTNHANSCEMRRLYVAPLYRGRGIGRQLALAQLEFAHLAGYRCVLLDTLSDMEAARGLYGELGFEEIPPYYFNPIPGAHYLKANL